jgi:hypothetical protein
MTWMQAIEAVPWTNWVQIVQLLTVTCLFVGNVSMARDVTIFVLTMLCVFLF